jgi:hypothetical protein
LVWVVSRHCPLLCRSCTPLNLSTLPDLLIKEPSSLLPRTLEKERFQIFVLSPTCTNYSSQILQQHRNSHHERPQIPPHRRSRSNNVSFLFQRGTPAPRDPSTSPADLHGQLPIAHLNNLHKQQQRLFDGHPKPRNNLGRPNSNRSPSYLLGYCSYYPN